MTCDARDTDPYVKRYPLLVFEVLSPSTEKIDVREKFSAAPVFAQQEFEETDENRYTLARGLGVVCEKAGVFWSVFSKCLRECPGGG